MNPHDGSISAEELLAEAGFLRRLARGLVADEHGAADLVQETLATALERPPRRDKGVRGWLATVAANLARNARRGARRREERERVAARPERVESGGEPGLERLELQRALFELVLALPAEQRAVLYLRYYEDLAPAAIAARLGLPLKTVKSRQTRALAVLRERLDARSGGDRREWLEALAPLARAGAWPVIRTAIGGVAVKKLVGLGVAACVALLAWLAVARGGLGEVRRRWEFSPEGGHVTVRELVQQPAALAPPLAAEVVAAREPGRAAADVATGALELAVQRSDGTPAGDLPIVLECRANPAPRVETVRARTDGEGRARLDGLFAGPVRIWLDHELEEAEVEAGTTRAYAFTLSAGLTVEGVVVDEGGAPVAGAEIWRGDSYPRWPGGFLLARSANDGTFRLLDVDSFEPIGARKRGHLPSSCWRPSDMTANADGVRQARLVLGSGGGSVRGRVLDPDGNPLAHAGVLAGPDGGWTSAAQEGVAPEAAFAETDEHGAFELPNDLPVGTHPIHASAHGFPVWRGEVEVAAGRTSELEIRLERGARVEGRVLGIDGAPASGVHVVASEEERGGYYHDRFAPSECTTDEQGWFALDWVAAGLRELNAWDSLRPEVGRARASVACASGETATCELRLERGNAIAGTVVDELGSPLAGWRVEAQTSVIVQWHPRRVETGADGRFELLNLGEGNHDLQVRAPGSGPPRARAAGIAVGTRDLVLTVAGAHVQPGTVSGRLVDPLAPSLADLEVTLWQAGGREGHSLELEPRTGVFGGSTPPGRYAVGVRRAGRELHRTAEFEVGEGGETDLGEIELVALGRVEVALAADFPARELERLRLSLERVDGSDAPLRFTDGLWHADDVRPGRWTVATHESELFLRGGEVEVEPGATARVEVSVESAIPVRLSYVDPAAGWITLAAHDGAGKLLRALRQRPIPREGRSLLSVGLPAGHVAIELSAEDGRHASLELDVDDGLRGGEPIAVELR